MNFAINNKFLGKIKNHILTSDDMYNIFNDYKTVPDAMKVYHSKIVDDINYLLIDNMSNKKAITINRIFSIIKVDSARLLFTDFVNLEDMKEETFNLNNTFSYDYLYALLLSVYVQKEDVWELSIDQEYEM